MKPEDFIKKYKAALKTQDWNTVDPLFHDNACVTFSDGTVHLGKSKVRIAFEHNFSIINSEEYAIQNVRWIHKNESMAAFVFEFYWEGIINKNLAKGNGIGTTVLISKNGKWVLLTENLSKKAAP
ncbi:nuclear transport factor 2 family protein [Maribacter algarum]|uniref:Nuclear transport factor 2 family protein n=1 Tax=Maribacter algarum (ex Zhang et al. 2020) TaxID=2578118 RepID=A0A5S3PGE7_9FLAO|nr:nuclear transport factor 2 family protein [Maribacter algarum]TMM53218.1 nuclear transport factor 2 family protein [Maribacter algarum]